MKEVETLIYSRLTGDTGTGSLESLLGASGRIFHGFQQKDPLVPSVTFNLFTSGEGQLVGDFVRTIEEFYQFEIFSNLHPDITQRLRRLFDGEKFTIPGAFTQVGAAWSVFDFEGPDAYDEALEVMRKAVRYRFFVVPSALSPI